MHWGAIEGRACDKWRVTFTLQLAVFSIKLFSRLKKKTNRASNKVYRSTSGSTQRYTFVHNYKGLTSLYLIILAVEFAARITRGLLHTLASIQDVAGITHTAF